MEGVFYIKKTGAAPCGTAPGAIVHRGWSSLRDGESMSAGAWNADFDLDLLDVDRKFDCETGRPFDVAHEEHLRVAVLILSGDLVKALRSPGKERASGDSETDELAPLLLDWDGGSPGLGLRRLLLLEPLIGDLGGRGRLFCLRRDLLSGDFDGDLARPIRVVKTDN